MKTSTKTTATSCVFCAQPKTSFSETSTKENFKRGFNHFLKTALLTLVIFVVGIGSSWGQAVSSHTPLITSGTYSAITGTSILGNVDDGNSSATNIGFTFNLGGQNFTQFVANSNGHIRLGATATTSSFSPLSTTTNTYSISAAGRDGRSSGGVIHTVTGSAPNRVCVIQYTGYRLLYSSTSATVSFQIRLYETTNVVEIIYNSATGNTTNRNAQVGIRGTSTTADTRNFSGTSSGWAALTAGTGSTTASWLSTSMPSNGRILRWSPPVVTACKGTPTPGNTISTGSVAAGSNANLSLSSTTSGSGVSYQWYSGASSSGPWTAFGTSSPTANPIVTANTWFYCTVTCGSLSGFSNPVLVIPAACIPVTTNGCTDGDVIARVMLNTLDNNSGTGCPSGLAGYSDYTSNSALTTTLMPSTTYNCTVYAGQWAEGYAAWIDYNDNLQFETDERIGFSNGQVAGSGQVGVLGSSATFPVTLSCTPPVGTHRLRVRAMYFVNGSAVTACGANSYGETEDYLITITAPPACPSPGVLTSFSAITPESATINWLTGCASSTTYDLEYGPAGFALGTGTMLTAQTVSISGDTASYVLSGLSSLTDYHVYYRAVCGAETSPWSVANSFSTLLATPLVSSLSVTSFCPGNSIDISGQDFVSITGVSIGGEPAASYVVNSTTSISAVVPNPFTGSSGVITVTNTSGSSSSADLTISPLPSSPSLSTSAVDPLFGQPITVSVEGPISGLSYNWYAQASGGLVLVTDPIYSSSACSNLYVAAFDGTCESERTMIELSVVNPSIISSAEEFCGIGGSLSLIALIHANASPVWESLNPGAILSSTTANPTSATISETSDFRLTVSAAGCADYSIVKSIGVYPLPTANVTASATGVCPGTFVTINSGLSAGNFTVSSIPHVDKTPPETAGVLMNNGTMVTPLSGGNSDDGGWGGIPIGFDFNFFGENFTTLGAGTNGVLMFGTIAGYGTANGQLGDYTFTGPPYFPNPANAGNLIALMATDLHMGNSVNGSLKYWTEGYAPNRKFVLKYTDVHGYSSNPAATVSVVLYETLGIVDIFITNKTFANSALVGLQNFDQTIGAVAPGRAGGAWTVTTPEGWRFSPPSDYTTVWTANGDEIASGTNIFTQDVSPETTTLYDISYTNQTTGCASDPGSAQVNMVILSSAPITGVSATSSVVSVCPGSTVPLAHDYTVSSSSITYSWQTSVDDGATWVNAEGATNATYSPIQNVASLYRVGISQCLGDTSYSAPVSIAMSPGIDCYCTPTYSSGTSAGDLISLVDIVGTTLNNNSGFVNGTPSYVFYDSLPNHTATLMPSTTYIMNVATGAWGSQGMAAWIDYNDDGVFSLTERIGATPGTIGTGFTSEQINATGSFTISLACTPPAGLHRMRVRTVYNLDGVLVDPCLSYTWGETEDYMVTIAPAPACPSAGLFTENVSTPPETTSADFTWDQGCSVATSYDIEYGPTGFTLGTGTLLSNEAVTITGTVASYTLQGLVSASSYDVYIRAHCDSVNFSAWSNSVSVSTLSTAPTTLPQTLCEGATVENLVATGISGSTINWYSSSTDTVPLLPTDVLVSGVYHAAQVVNGIELVDRAATDITISLNTYDTTYITICGTTYLWDNNGVSYTQSGLYTGITTAACVTQVLNLTITPPALPTVEVTSSSIGAVCPGIPITFTATTPNSGAITISWQVNGVTIPEASGSTFTSLTLSDGDVVTASLVVNAPCISSVPVLSSGSAVALLPQDQCNTIFALNVFLDGYYVTGSNPAEMTAARYLNLVASGSANPGLATDVDLITVQLRSTTNTETIVHTVTPMLQTNGYAVCEFPASAVGQSYYVVVDHRATNPLWSATPIAITPSSTYDMANALANAYSDGNPAIQPMDAITSGLYGIWMGELNEDGYLDAVDYSIFEIETNAAQYLNQYLLDGDFNGDTYVDASDFAVFDSNSDYGAYEQRPY